MIVSDVPGTTRDSDRHGARARRKRRSCSSTPPALRRKRRQRQGDRVLLGAAGDPRGRARRRRARPRRLERGRRRPGSRGRRRRAQGGLLDARRPLEVGHRRRWASRTCVPRLEDRLRQRPPIVAVSAKTGRGLGRLLDRVGSSSSTSTRAGSRPGSSTASSPSCGAAAGPARRAPAAEPPLRDPGLDPPAALPFLRQRPGLVTRDYGYWVENRLRERFGLEGVPVDHRLRAARMKVAVVGAGSWGAAFAGAHGGARARGRRSPAAGRRPIWRVDRGVAADGRPRGLVAGRPSRAFAEVVARLPGSAPVIILTKGLDPETGKRLSQVVKGREALALSGPNHAEEIAQGLPGRRGAGEHGQGARQRAPARDPLGPSFACT